MSQPRSRRTLLRSSVLFRMLLTLAMSVVVVLSSKLHVGGLNILTMSYLENPGTVNLIVLALSHVILLDVG